MLAIADDLAVAVFVEDGELGSSTAGPLMKEFLTGI
jgi:cell division protein FtsI/penicillin-binding protein 2